MGKQCNQPVCRAPSGTVRWRNGAQLFPTQPHSVLDTVCICLGKQRPSCIPRPVTQRHPGQCGTWLRTVMGGPHHPGRGRPWLKFTLSPLEGRIKRMPASPCISAFDEPEKSEDKSDRETKIFTSAPFRVLTPVPLSSPRPTSTLAFGAFLSQHLTKCTSPSPTQLLPLLCSPCTT